MENEASNTENVSTTESDATATTTSGDSASTESTDTSSESANGETQATEGDSENSQPEFVKDSEGKEFVPKEAFEKRLAALTAKSKKSEELLEAIKTNPEIRKQYLGEEDKQVAQEEAPKPSTVPASGNTDPVELMKPINTWLSGLGHTPEHQSFYREYTGALLKTVESSVVAYVNKAIQENLSREVAPLKKFMSNSTLESFKRSNPDFEQHKAKVLEISQKRNLPIEDAYKLIKHDILLKELASLKGGKSTAQTAANRNKLKNTPINKRQATFSGEAAENLNLNDAVTAALRPYYRK